MWLKTIQCERRTDVQLAGKRGGSLTVLPKGLLTTCVYRCSPSLSGHLAVFSRWAGSQRSALSDILFAEWENLPKAQDPESFIIVSQEQFWEKGLRENRKGVSF